MATVKANTTLVITPKNGATYDLTFGGITQYGRTSGDTIGVFPVDKEYTLVKHGEVEVYAIDKFGVKAYGASEAPTADSIGGVSPLKIGNDLAFSSGGLWHYIPQAKGAIVLDSSTSGDDSGWLPSSVNPERFGFLLTGASAVVAITGSDDASSVAAGYAVTITMDTAASTLVTPPMNFDYKFIKFTVMSLGATSSIKVSRGV